MGSQRVRLQQALAEINFVRPSVIQSYSLPKIWDGRSLIAQSHNGTGKTACFVLGMLHKIDPAIKQPQALCVAPNRELAKQISVEVMKMGAYLISPECVLEIGESQIAGKSE